MTPISSSTATTKLVTLVTEQRRQSKDDGNSLNLRNVGIIETLPAEVIEMIKDEVSRYIPWPCVILIQVGPCTESVVPF